MTVKLIKFSKGKRIKNPKGDIIKFISKKNRLFKKFGEMYFSEIKKNKVKGWNFHGKLSCMLFVPYGKVEFIIYNSFKKKMTKTILSDKNLNILNIPSKNWFCFKSLVKKSIIANILDGTHDPTEVKKSNKIRNIIIK